MIDDCSRLTGDSIDRLRGLLPPQLVVLLRTGLYGTDSLETFGCFKPDSRADGDGFRGSNPGSESCSKSGSPVGALVNRYVDGGVEARLFLLLVSRKIAFGSQEWKQVASELFSRAVEEAAARGAQRYAFEYDDDLSGRPEMEELFAGKGFGEPLAHGRVCRCVTRKILDAPWVKKPVFPDGFEDFLWNDLTVSESQWLKNDGLSAMRVPPVLSPFRDPHILESLNSMGLRAGDRLVGWQINHRVAQTTIRYTATFVREDLQPFGLALPLLGKSIGLQFSRGMWCNRAVFMVPYSMTEMSRFVDRRFKRYVDEVREILRFEKKLRVENPALQPMNDEVPALPPVSEMNSEPLSNVN